MRPKTIFVLILAAACLASLAAAAAGTAAAGTAAAATAAAATTAATRTCNSTDLRYPFQPGGPKTFGVFGLKISGGSCATAHRVAKAWMNRFETAFRAGRTVLPRSVDGFMFKTVPARLPQTFRERGRSANTTIGFDYVIPNG